MRIVAKDKRNKYALLTNIAILSMSCFGCSSKSLNSYPVEEGDFSIVSPLDEPNDYRVEEFKNVYADYPKNYREEEYTIYGYENLMPIDIYQKYGIGAFRVYRAKKDDKTVFAEYLLMKDMKLYDLCPYGAGDKKPHGIIEFLFTDFNKDGYVEVTTSLKAQGKSLLSSFDTKTGIFINAHTIAYSKHLSFEYNKKEKCINIVKRTLFDSGNVGELIDGYLKVEAYKRDFHLNKEEYFLESTNYSAKITYDKATTVFPLIYDGLKLLFEVKVEMTYLGESFSYVNDNGCKESAVAIFTQGNYKLINEERECTSVASDFTVEHGEVMSETYSYCEAYPDQLNYLGSYDMTISYRGENVMVKNALEIL